jgi:hypothetical protein
MTEQRADDEPRVVEIDAVLEHWRQMKERTARIILSLQKGRDLKNPTTLKLARKRQ